MVVTCEQVWQEISNYLEDDLDPALRAAMDEHIRQCKHCTAVLEGTRNVIQLYGDERLFSTPLGFSWRLHGKLARTMPRRMGTAYGWVVALAAMGLVAGSWVVANSAVRSQTAMRSEHAQTGRAIPSGLVVLVAGHSKVFHVAGCPFIHGEKGSLQSMKAAEAIEEGYAPCVRCLGQYVSHLAAAMISKHSWVLA
jgi:Putative zinc-finger